MRPVAGTLRRRLRAAGRSLAIATAVLLLTATPAAAAGPGSYSVTATHGASFTVLSTNNLVTAPVPSNGTLFYLATTGTGLHRLPFPLHLYNQTYVNIAISSNGNVQPGVTSPAGTSTLANDCPPTAAFGKPAVLVYWDELVYNTQNPQKGIFLRTSGAAPHRRFTVSWQGDVAVTAAAPVLAQVVFQEGVQTFSFVYGQPAVTSMTSGVQSKQRLSWTTWQCPGSGQPITAGLMLTFQHH